MKVKNSYSVTEIVFSNLSAEDRELVIPTMAVEELPVEEITLSLPA